MDLLILGTATGVVGGLVPGPLHFIALTQVALKQWGRALLVLVGLPLLVDTGLLLLTYFFYRYIPSTIAHDVAYLGGAVILIFGSYALLERKDKSEEELARSGALTYASVSVATLGELTAPGTWVYWLTIAGPILAESRVKGIPHVVPFFAGGLVGYYGAALLSVWVLAWGASLHKKFRHYLFLAANLMLVVLGISYIVRARMSH